MLCIGTKNQYVICRCWDIFDVDTIFCEYRSGATDLLGKYCQRPASPSRMMRGHRWRRRRRPFFWGGVVFAIFSFYNRRNLVFKVFFSDSNAIFRSLPFCRVVSPTHHHKTQQKNVCIGRISRCQYHCIVHDIILRESLIQHYNIYTMVLTSRLTAGPARKYRGRMICYLQPKRTTCQISGHRFLGRLFMGAETKMGHPIQTRI